MRQVHYADEKLFVDYARKKPHLIDPTTGAPAEVDLFVSALGASTRTQGDRDRAAPPLDREPHRDLCLQRRSRGSPCRWPTGGSSCACATRPSSASPRSTRASPSCS